MPKIPIALQLYSVRTDCAKGLAAVLERLGKMGYQGVEFAGYYDFPAAELKKMLDANGLKCAGTHIGLETLLGDKFGPTVEFNRVLGNKYLIVPGLAKDYTATKAGWKKAAEAFNRVSPLARKAGMWVGYHNHHVEFTPLEGELPWDVFFGTASKDVVMQFDTGNALLGGGAADVYLAKYPGRARTIHLKEYAKANDKAIIGEGDVPWKKVFELCTTIGRTEWYIVEQESYAFPPMDCAAKCLEALHRMGL